MDGQSRSEGGQHDLGEPYPSPQHSTRLTPNTVIGAPGAAANAWGLLVTLRCRRRIQFTQGSLQDVAVLSVRTVHPSGWLALQSLEQRLQLINVGRRRRL